MMLVSTWQHLLIFNVYWFVAVKFGNVAAFVLIPAYVVFCTNQLKTLLSDRWLHVFIIAGVAIDVVLHQLGWIQFLYQPFWLLPLWLAFILSFQWIYRFLIFKPWWISALWGAIFGPVSYWAGTRLGTLTIYHGEIYLLWSLMWALVFVALCWRFARKLKLKDLNGYA